MISSDRNPHSGCCNFHLLIVIFAQFTLNSPQPTRDTSAIDQHLKKMLLTKLKRWVSNYLSSPGKVGFFSPLSVFWEFRKQPGGCALPQNNYCSILLMGFLVFVGWLALLSLESPLPHRVHSTNDDCPVPGPVPDALPRLLLCHPMTNNNNNKTTTLTLPDSTIT